MPHVTEEDGSLLFGFSMSLVKEFRSNLGRNQRRKKSMTFSNSHMTDKQLHSKEGSFRERVRKARSSQKSMPRLE